MTVRTTTPAKPSLLDRIMRWLGLAREKAYRVWAWQNGEAIIVSTRSNRAWRCTVLGQIPDERIEVVEINRETGEPLLPEPESYQWKPTINTDRLSRIAIVPDRIEHHRESENWGGDAP